MKKRKVAIFDIDGTIFRSSLLIEVTEALVDAKIFPPKVNRSYARAKSNWLDRKSHYDNYIRAVIKVFDKNIRGIHENVFRRVAKTVIRRQKNRVYRFTRDLVKKLKKQNYFLLAISHSPKIIVDEFSRHLGFDKVYGRLIGMNYDGTFTGETLMPELIFNKAKVLKRAVTKENLTLKKSVGVGDTESDIPLLKIVDRPICFNPSRKLLNYAKRNNWEIVVERKDVIHRL